MEQFGQQMPARDPGLEGDMDAELARAIEASYAAQTNAGIHQSEDEMIAEAMRLSALEEEERKKRLEGGSGAAATPDEAGPFGDRRAAAPPVPATAAERLPTGAELGGGGLDPSIDADFAAIAASGLLDERPQSGASYMAMPGGFPRTGGQGEALMPGRMDADTMAAAAVAEQADMSDAQLAAAIEASYNAQTEDGRVHNEEDLLAQAMRMSQQEEDARQRASLRQEQEQELQESVLMDQMREDEQKRRRIEEEQLQRLEAQRQEEEATRIEAQARQKKEDEEQKKARIPAEPPAGEPGRVDFMIRAPDGKRLRRAFRGTDTVGQVYDFVDVECSEAVGSMVGYRLVTAMPRQAYEDRSRTLAEVGLQGQCALNIEQLSA